MSRLDSLQRIAHLRNRISAHETVLAGSIIIPTRGSPLRTRTLASLPMTHLPPNQMMHLLIRETLLNRHLDRTKLEPSICRMHVILDIHRSNLPVELPANLDDSSTPQKVTSEVLAVDVKDLPICLRYYVVLMEQVSLEHARRVGQLAGGRVVSSTDENHSPTLILHEVLNRPLTHRLVAIEKLIQKLLSTRHSV